MDETTNQGNGEAHARVHKLDPPGEGRAQVFEENRQQGSQARFFEESRNEGSKARFFEENRQQGREESDTASAKSAQAAEQVRDRAGQIVDQADSGVAALTLGSDAASMTFGIAANFMLSWQRQVSDFLSMRIEKDLQFGRKLLEARDPVSLLWLQSQYARETMTDYSTCVTDISKRTGDDAHHPGSQIARETDEAAGNTQAAAQRSPRR